MAKNFTPSIEHSDLQGYSGQGAFRFWCQMCLPLVYDDTLSYYELMNKMVIYLNNVISDVSTVETNLGNLNDAVNNNFNALLNAYNRLQNYVNNYFDNLDVQDEINNKLDEMALNGELSEVFNNFATTELWQPRLSTTSSGGCANLYINSAGGKVLIDCAESGQTSALGQLLSQKLNGDKLDCLVITHFDGDHAGGAPYVIQNYCDEDTVFIVGLDFDASYFGANGQRAGQNREAFYAAISAAGYDNNVITATQGMIQRFGCIKLEFFNADPAFVSGYNTAHSDSGADTYTNPTINNFSLITYVYSSGVTFMNCADVEKLAQQNNKDFIKPCDIFQVPHHNGNMNGCFEFHQRANPRIAYFNYNTDGYGASFYYRYFSRYRKTVKDIPVLSTEGKGVYFKVANGCILSADGTSKPIFRNNIPNIREILPFPQDETSEGWEHNSWKLSEIQNMRQFCQGKTYTCYITDVNAHTAFNQLKPLFDGVATNIYSCDLSYKSRYTIPTNQMQTKFVYIADNFNDDATDLRVQNAVLREIVGANNAGALSINVAHGGTLSGATKIPNKQMNYLAVISDSTGSRTLYCHHSADNRLVGNEMRVSYDSDTSTYNIIIWSLLIENDTVNAFHGVYNNTVHRFTTMNTCTLVSVTPCW